MLKCNFEVHFKIIDNECDKKQIVKSEEDLELLSLNTVSRKMKKGE